jgi:membrane protease YdiL (CAAX protease family)
VLVSTQRLTWRPAPGWPEPPPGWTPPPGWAPPPDWPPAPRDWQFWATPPPAPPAAPVVPQELTRAGLVTETRLVIIAGLGPGIAAALVTLGVHAATGASLRQLPTLTPHQPVLNTILAILAYLPVVAAVPLVLLLLARTGQRPATLGLTRASWRDLGVAAGLAAGAFGCELVIGVVLAPLEHSRLVNTRFPHVPAYYLIIGIAMALFTAVAEEVIVNGYLITRLDQLGWSPTKAFWLSLAVRTSYHVYYGIAAVFTVPLGWLVTRSFQKHRRLARPILAHFLFDSTAFTIAILVLR